MGRRCKQTFLQIQAKRHIERHSTSLLTREMQIKTMRDHFSLVRKAIIKRSANNNCLRGCGEKGTLLHCLWEYKWVQPQWRMVWRFLKKLKTELSYDPAIPLWGILFRENDNLKRYMHPNVHPSTVYNSQDMEAT